MTAVRHTQGIDPARRVAITTAVESAVRTFGLDSATAGERVEVRLNGPAPNRIETLMQHDVGSLEARHPWWVPGSGGWHAEGWTRPTGAGEVGVVTGPKGALIETQNRNVRATGRDPPGVARALGAVLEDRTLEEHIAQGLGQALVAPANERWPEGWKIPTGRLRYWIGLVRVRERRAPLRVAAAAIGDERSVVVSLPPPARHFDVMAAAARDHSDEEIRQWGQRGQGFVDPHGRWLSRAAAEDRNRGAEQWGAEQGRGEVTKCQGEEKNPNSRS